jgi:hypothetical protein
MDLREGIIGAASALGMSPVDLATIISYETAGTFDPMKKGPTTQWGQHKGLIQFGEPQAKQHGVDWNDPLGSQLGPDGAIVNYYRSSGWKPGMSFMDAYSVVNAGAPGRYNASDANNGGAPGTVADKVNSQMAGHRKKAEALLGMGAAPAQPGMGAPNWTGAVEAQPSPAAAGSGAPQPGMGAPNWSNAVDEAGGAPFPLAPQGGVTPTPTPTEAVPEDDYLSQIAGMDLSGAYGPKAGAPGGSLSGGRGPTIDQITATLLKQRKQGAPMPFGLFPGA